MTLKSLTLTNFTERNGWDYEIVSSGNQNLYRHLRGIPVVGGGNLYGDLYKEGSFVSLRNVKYGNPERVYSSASNQGVGRFAYSKYQPYRIYFTLRDAFTFAIEYPSSYYSVYPFGDENTDYHMLDAGNNRVASFSRTQSSIGWKYENNLSGPANFTPSGTIIINNPRVFMFWKNYWYIASPNDNRIQVLAPDFSSTVGTLNLAATEGVYALINLNDAYLGIVVIHKNSFEIPKRMYLWDGNWLNIYFHRLTFNKELKGSVLYNGATYLFLDDAQNTDIYAFSPSGLKFVRRLQNLKVVTEVYGNENHPLSSISSGLNFIVIPSYYSSFNSIGTSRTIILWYPEDDIVVEIDALRNSSELINYGYYCFALKDEILLLDKVLVGSLYDIRYTPIFVSNFFVSLPSGNLNEDFYIETNWLNLNNSNYVKIQSIEVFTENLAGRTITASIEYMREKTREKGTFDLPSITQSGYQRIENIGLVASKFKLKFSYRGSSSSDPFLFKKVIITYDDEI